MASEVSSSLGGLQWPQRSSATSVVGSSLGGCQRPRRSAVALEVISDLNFELSGLNNLYSSASLASYCCIQQMFPGGEGGGGQNGHVTFFPLYCR